MLTSVGMLMWIMTICIILIQTWNRFAKERQISLSARLAFRRTSKALSLDLDKLQQQGGGWVVDMVRTNTRSRR